MTVTINGTTGIANDGGYTGDGVVFADTTPANTLVTDTSGNVGIGTSSPSKKLDVRGASGAIHLESTTGTNAAFLEITNTGGTYYFGVENSAGTSFGCAPYAQIDWVASGRSRQVYMEGRGVVQTIDSSGNLLVGTTSNNGRLTVDATALGGSNQGVWAKNSGGSGATFIAWNAVTTGNPVFVDFYTETSATQRGTISYNRGAGLTAYNTTSDYRAKDIHGPVLNALETVAQLKPYMGTMKGATVERPMFVAHEAQQVTAYAVVGDKDAVNDKGEPVYQQMDHSTLVPLLTAAIKEQQAIITALTARVTALEGA